MSLPTITVQYDSPARTQNFTPCSCFLTPTCRNWGGGCSWKMSQVMFSSDVRSLWKRNSFNKHPGNSFHFPTLPLFPTKKTRRQLISISALANGPDQNLFLVMILKLKPVMMIHWPKKNLKNLGRWLMLLQKFKNLQLLWKRDARSASNMNASVSQLNCIHDMFFDDPANSCKWYIVNKCFGLAKPRYCLTCQGSEVNDKVKALREAIAQKLAAAKEKTVTLFLVHSPEAWVWACHPKQLAYVMKEFTPIYRL